MPRCRADHLLMFVLLLFGGCASTYEHGPLRPEVDLSPLGCGYKWFQSGYSPTLEMACDQDRSDLIDSQMALAREHAQEPACFFSVSNPDDSRSAFVRQQLRHIRMQHDSQEASPHIEVSRPLWHAMERVPG